MIFRLEDKKQYVSRGALKLKYFFEDYPMAIQKAHCLDIGSSTGGFSQLLLEYDIASLTCVDVGRDQIHHLVATHPKVSVFENQDIRHFKSDKKFEFIVCDVSFISLDYVMESIDRLAIKDILLLFKPQFEVGIKVKRDKIGVVRDDKAVQLSLESFIAKASVKWSLLHHQPSKLKGKNGNIEFFFHFRKNA